MRGKNGIAGGPVQQQANLIDSARDSTHKNRVMGNRPAKHKRTVSAEWLLPRYY